VESQCHFDLHFLCGHGWWAFVHIFIGHLYFFCTNCPFRILFWEFVHLFSGLLILSGFGFLSSLYILVINLLSNV
jgi:hypothetical protein